MADLLIKNLIDKKNNGWKDVFSKDAEAKTLDELHKEIDQQEQNAINK